MLEWEGGKGEVGGIVALGYMLFHQIDIRKIL